MNKSKTVVKKTCCLAKSIVKKTQEIFEISQINIKIMQLKNKLERKYVKIGYSIYSKQKNDGIDKLISSLKNEKFKIFCEEVDKINSEIKNLEEELDEIKKDETCVMECVEDCIDEFKNGKCKKGKKEDKDKSCKNHKNEKLEEKSEEKFNDNFNNNYGY